ncbi:MAG TPA: VWA domain-containing protein [Acidobacteriota bacterium]|nr:VWA domain-containing protein [Acidobacteriota bacterium]
MKRHLLLLLIALLCASPAAAQEQSEQDPQPAQDPPQGFRIDVRVDQVFLAVSARSAQGGFVGDLTPQDIRIFEDGVEQEITNFYQDQAPAHVALLIDASGSTRFTQSSIQSAAYRFASELGEEDRVAIITFSSKVRLIQDWTNDLKELDNSLKSIWPKGQTLLHDAVYLAFDDLFKDVEGKKAIILLTDGVDSNSYYRSEEVLRLAQSSEASVYVVSLLDEYRQAAIGYRAEAAARRRPVPEEMTDRYIRQSEGFLRKLSYTTGARMFPAAAATHLTEIYETVAQEIKNLYYISYTPTNSAKDGTWRRIEIESPTRPGVVLRTRPGYYADPDGVSTGSR